MAVGIGIGAVALLAIATAWISTTQAETMVQGPTNLSPAHNTTLTSSAFTMADWSDVEGTSTPITYRYESSLSSTTNPDGSFTAPLFQSGVLSSSSISTAGTAEGTYFWHARAVDDMGSSSPWSATWSVVVDNEATSTPPDEEDDADELVEELEALQDEFPDFFWQLQWLINDLLDEDNGTSTPQPGSASIDNTGMTVRAGGHLDFVGRNFGSEENVEMRLSGSLIRTVHADGGGNFSTGSMSAPTTPGTYTYVFTGQNSGRTANSVITVVP